MATYEEYEIDQIAKAKKQAQEYEASRRAEAEKAAADVKKVYDTANATAREQATASKQETETAYREVYDVNAINEHVARRQAQESMRNMGLANSGMSRTEQTAISLRRGRADSEATRQKQAAIDSIMRELDALTAQNDSRSAAEQSAIHTTADADIRNNRLSLEAAARQNAAALYTADQERAAAEYAARLEAETAAANAGSGTSMLDQVIKLMNAGNGMSYDEAYEKVYGYPPSVVTARQNYEAAKTTRGGPEDWRTEVAVKNDPYNRTVEGDRAVLYRVIAGAKQLYDRGGFGNTATPEASSGMKDYLKVFVEKGYITEDEMYKIINSVATGEEPYMLVFGGV